MEQEKLIKIRNKFTRNSKLLYAVGYTLLGISFAIIITLLMELIYQSVNNEYDLFIEEHSFIFYTLFLVSIIFGCISIYMAFNIVNTNIEMRTFFYLSGLVDDSCIKAAIKGYNDLGVRAYRRIYLNWITIMAENEILKEKLQEYETKHQVGNMDE